MKEQKSLPCSTVLKRARFFSNITEYIYADQDHWTTSADFGTAFEASIVLICCLREYSLLAINNHPELALR